MLGPLGVDGGLPIAFCGCSTDGVDLPDNGGVGLSIGKLLLLLSGGGLLDEDCVVEAFQSRPLKSSIILSCSEEYEPM